MIISWIAIECASRHGKIYVIDEILDIEPPLHPDCRCIIDRMDAVAAGGATKDGENGAEECRTKVMTLQ